MKCAPLLLSFVIRNLYKDDVLTANGEVQGFRARNKDQSLLQRWSWSCCQTGPSDEGEVRDNCMAISECSAEKPLV